MLCYHWDSATYTMRRIPFCLQCSRSSRCLCAQKTHRLVFYECFRARFCILLSTRESEKRTKQRATEFIEDALGLLHDSISHVSEQHGAKYRRHGWETGQEGLRLALSSTQSRQVAVCGKRRYYRYHTLEIIFGITSLNCRSGPRVSCSPWFAIFDLQRTFNY